jgi:hypothetical protein
MGKFGNIVLLVSQTEQEKELRDFVFYNHYISESEKCLILAMKLLKLSEKHLQKAQEYT